MVVTDVSIMSDLNNLFKQHQRKRTPPSQRLLMHSPPQAHHNERGQPPHKSILKLRRKGSEADTKDSDHLGLHGGVINEAALSREINLYNKEVCKLYFRNVFFVMAAIFVVSGMAGWTQAAIVPLVILAAARLRFPLSYWKINQIWVKVGRSSLWMLVYYFCFKVLWGEFYPFTRPLPAYLVSVLAANALLNTGCWLCLRRGSRCEL